MPKNKKDPTHTDDYYETIASQEEVYLEEGVEKLREREILVTEISSEAEKDLRKGASPDQVGHAAEDLIGGDADDPPLSDELVAEMLSKTSKR